MAAELTSQQPGAPSARLAGRVSLITGAGRGIGRALAMGFAAEGAQVVLTARTAAEVQAAADEIVAAGGRALARPCDVADEEQVASLAEFLDRELGRLDILVNNAALRMIHVGDPTSYSTSLLELTVDEWDRMVAVNLRGPFLTCKLLAPLLFASGHASVVNISSGGGTSGMAGRAPYCASKFGLEGLSQSLAEEWRPYGAAVNTLSPGVSVLTDALKLEQRAAGLRQRFVRPEMMVPPAVWLAGQDLATGGITGQRVDAFDWVQERGLGGWETWGA